MGYTTETIHRVETIINTHAIRNVMDLGAQNNYSQPLIPGHPVPYMKEWYENRNIAYTAIDLSGENESLQINLAKPLEVDLGQFDLLVDAGTSEHVGIDGEFNPWGIYACWKTKHDLLKPGGFMISENPMAGNWPLHGFNYYTLDFYTQLAHHCGYEIIELGKHAAMGNVIDGWNVHCVLRKKDDAPFIPFSKFELCGIKQS